MLTRIGAGEAVAYVWSATGTAPWPAYLLAYLMPAATVIRASVDDELVSLRTVLAPGVRLFAFHLDCTKTARFPRARADLIAWLRERGIATVNADVQDTTKPSIQAACAALGLPTTACAPNGAADERVLVKTALNYGGRNESALSEEHRRLLEIDLPPAPFKGPSSYRMLPRGEVPEEWWLDSRLAIERFVTNRAGRWTRVYFAFNRVALRHMTGTGVVMKVGSSRTEAVWRCTIGGNGNIESHDAGLPWTLVRDLQAFRGKMGLDMEAVDFMHDDAGVSYIVDANPTPYYGDQLAAVTEHLSGAAVPGL